MKYKSSNKRKDIQFWFQQRKKKFRKKCQDTYILLDIAHNKAYQCKRAINKNIKPIKSLDK